MNEILDDLDILANADLDVTKLALAGVQYGSDAKQSIEIARIVDVTLSPIVSATKTGSGGRREYFGASGAGLSLDEVARSAASGDGILHIANGISYKVYSGRVVGFSLNGPPEGPLSHFSDLRSRESFLSTFGAPDLTEENNAFGELLGYWDLYRRSRRKTYWSCDPGRLSLVSLGEY